jgi:hypothetical protein
MFKMESADVKIRHNFGMSVSKKGVDRINPNR